MYIQAVKALVFNENVAKANLRNFLKVSLTTPDDPH